MTNVIRISSVVFAGALAYIFGYHLPSDAMAVGVGALCGITASIPVSVALYIAASRNWGLAGPSRESTRTYTPRKRSARRPTVVINPPQPNHSAFAFQPNPLYLPPQLPPQTLASVAPREFRIVGDN